MAEILKLATFEPDVTLIDLIETLLERAKSGDLISLACVTEARGRMVGTAFRLGAEGSMNNLLSGASQLQHRLNTRIDEARGS